MYLLTYNNNYTQCLPATSVVYGVWRGEVMAVRLTGRTTLPNLTKFGLELRKPEDNVDTICHSGALVNWMQPLGDYIGPNVVSVHEVLHLASRGRSKAVHIVSIIATLSMHLSDKVIEQDRGCGYSTSKYMAERMVAAARWCRTKAPVYRVPFVTASARRPATFRSTAAIFLHSLIAGSIKLGSFRPWASIPRLSSPSTTCAGQSSLL